MKKLLIGVVAVFALGCVPKQNAVGKNEIVLSLESECPSDGNCKIEVFKENKLVVKQDEFGHNYYEKEYDPNKKVIKYSYSRKVKGDIQDAGYREEVVFELDHLGNQKYADSDLQQTKMLFGRFCFCKGQTGNYKVTSGVLSIQNQKAILDFTVSEVPQIIKNITFIIK